MMMMMVMMMMTYYHGVNDDDPANARSSCRPTNPCCGCLLPAGLVYRALSEGVVRPGDRVVANAEKGVKFPDFAAARTQEEATHYQDAGQTRGGGSLSWLWWWW
jgi:hypothetical protein